ncbi:hypothetical protein C8J57DRAFT_1066117 [Mycena rebaudengoi]|nr:hypothetical protein C8J57DRAFT_1066117 [Mycena rebaudengoi]
MRRASDQVKTKPWHIDSSSGEAPQSHPGVLEAAMSDQRKALNHKATFICSGAVNVGHLLRLSRKQLVEIAEEIGANALVDERWDCTICGPKHRPNGTFKVDISYTASAVQCRIPDPHRPVALEKAKSVPGLMTIVRHTSND